MIKHISDFWSSPDGIYDFNKMKIHKAARVNKTDLKSRVVIFSNPHIWEEQKGLLDNGDFQGIVIISGDLIGLSKIIKQIAFSKIQRIIAYRTTNTSNNIHSMHKLSLVLNYSSNKRPYREIREKYTYCPLCGKSSKDYGGKKHHYPSDGTWIRDVWNKLKLSEPVVNRFQSNYR